MRERKTIFDKIPEAILANTMPALLDDKSKRQLYEALPLFSKLPMVREGFKSYWINKKRLPSRLTAPHGSDHFLLHLINNPQLLTRPEFIEDVIDAFIKSSHEEFSHPHQGKWRQEIIFLNSSLETQHESDSPDYYTIYRYKVTHILLQSSYLQILGIVISCAYRSLAELLLKRLPIEFRGLIHEEITKHRVLSPWGNVYKHLIYQEKILQLKTIVDLPAPTITPLSIVNSPKTQTAFGHNDVSFDREYLLNHRYNYFPTRGFFENILEFCYAIPIPEDQLHAYNGNDEKIILIIKKYWENRARKAKSYDQILAAFDAAKVTPFFQQTDRDACSWYYLCNPCGGYYPTNKRWLINTMQTIMSDTLMKHREKLSEPAFALLVKHYTEGNDLFSEVHEQFGIKSHTRKTLKKAVSLFSSSTVIPSPPSVFSLQFFDESKEEKQEKSHKLLINYVK